MDISRYRGRIAPSPTGYLHVGHAQTFWTASQRAQAQQGVLVLRNEDLDQARCKQDFVEAMLEDLTWFGLVWQEGPDRGGAVGPYSQNQRRHLYAGAFEQLRAAGYLYPCYCSRQDVLRAATAPHPADEEAIYPGTCREIDSTGLVYPRVSWRFKVADRESVAFTDGLFGRQEFRAGQDFGDFVVWRHDDVPAYQLAVVVDDAAMQITEVVRGADLLVSTARQILLYRALSLPIPDFYHCPLVTDEQGVRLAKRHASLSLRSLREAGMTPAAVRQRWTTNDRLSPIANIAEPNL
mgnify:CR=1 FL=1